MNKFSSDLTIGEMLDVGHELISTKSEEDFDGSKTGIGVGWGCFHEQMVCRQGVLTLPKHC